jgi:hypothetical protein
MDPKKLLSNVPWITKEGYFDPAQFPIESVLKQAFSDDDQEFRTGLNMLRSMYGHGRTEAGVFLLGVLVNCDDSWEKRIACDRTCTADGTNAKEVTDAQSARHFL